MSTQRIGLAAKARSDRHCRFTSLAHRLTPAFLKETWAQMNHRAASGIDGETTAQFEQDLESRIDALVARLKAGRYRAPPVRRVEIPKGDGRVRLLGIPTVEDRLLQRAVARLLGAIFEQDFLECSYGFRPGRSPHDAVRVLRHRVIAGKVMHVYEADIRGYFDRIQHAWLHRMVAQRIADPVILGLIGKWLRAGAMRDGVVLRSDTGAPQGGPISPVLANVYLHFALDLWFERRFRRQCRGAAYLIRFADDFVACFQYEADAKAFGDALAVRMQEFGVELAPEKTRRLLFGRFARERRGIDGRTPDTFDFLGFTHVCGRDRQGRFAVIRLPSQRSRRRFLDRVWAWLQAHMHWRPRDQQRHLSLMLRGFFHYFAIPHCGALLNAVQGEVRRMWRRALRRRGQRSALHWSVLERRDWFKLPDPLIVHPTV